MTLSRATVGFTLIETLISIVVVGIALAGFASLFVLTFSHGADPLRDRQALAVAEAYLEEILLRPYADPDTGATCGAPEASRAVFDDACDYNALANNGCLVAPATTACDQNGNTIVNLAGYNVAVVVTQPTVGPPNVNALRVEVTVTALGSNTRAQLVGHRLALP